MALNAVQKEINVTMQRYPKMSKVEALHWNRKHNPETLKRHREQKNYSKEYKSLQARHEKGLKMIKTMGNGQTKKVPGKLSFGGATYVHKDNENTYSIIQPEISANSLGGKPKQGLLITAYRNNPNEFSMPEQVRVFAGDDFNGLWDKYGKKVYGGSSKKGAKAGSGRSGG